jgi:hypothetical protein
LRIGLGAVLIGLAALVLLGRADVRLTPSSGELETAYPGLELDEGRAPTTEELVPSVEAAFTRESYAPRSTATLLVAKAAPGVTLRIFHVGPETIPMRGDNELVGVPVTKPRQLGNLAGGARITVPIAAWPSGVYFAKLRSANHLVGFAPFLVQPWKLGEHPVAVVLPTRTWQAYNLRDENGDGIGDSWYAKWRIHAVRLGRPFLNRGVPYHFRLYDLPFLRWLSSTGKKVDYLADSDLDVVESGKALASAYKLIVFPSHHEYVTTHEYDVTEQYRDAGGNLAFMSANNFFWQVVKRGDTLRRTKLWRDLGRPEAALIGVQYRASNARVRRQPWIVRSTPANTWLFRGTPTRPGSEVSLGGIEIDATTTDSPKGTQVVAEIPKIFRPGFTAQMTYYETPRGAKVFAAGAFTFVQLPIVEPMNRVLENLWQHLTKDPLPQGGTPSLP